MSYSDQLNISKSQNIFRVRACVFLPFLSVYPCVCLSAKSSKSHYHSRAFVCESVIREAYTDNSVDAADLLLIV